MHAHTSSSCGCFYSIANNQITSYPYSAESLVDVRELTREVGRLKPQLRDLFEALSTRVYVLERK